eukprot:COSAG01_NODE_49085_length_375_cov_0.887681_1_plen_82_part_01
MRPVSARENPSSRESVFGLEPAYHVLLPTFWLSDSHGFSPPSSGPRIFFGWDTDGGCTHTPSGAGRIALSTGTAGGGAGAGA